MQNRDTDVSCDRTLKTVSVRDSVTRMREAMTLNSAMTTLDEMSHQSRKSAPNCVLPSKMQPIHNSFFAMQKDVRAPFRGESIPLKGAESLETPESKHSAEYVAFMKEQQKTKLPMHIKADPVNAAQKAQYNIQDLQAKDLRDRVMLARKKQLLNYETSSAVPSALARPLSIYCKDAEREKAASTYTQGNEEAYRVVEQLNSRVTGFKDTAANGAQKMADEFNAAQRQKTVANQVQQPKSILNLPSNDDGEMAN